MAHPETQFYNGRGRLHCLLIVVVLSMLLLLLGMVAGIIWLLFKIFA